MVREGGLEPPPTYCGLEPEKRLSRIVIYWSVLFSVVIDPLFTMVRGCLSDVLAINVEASEGRADVGIFEKYDTGCDANRLVR